MIPVTRNLNLINVHFWTYNTSNFFFEILAFCCFFFNRSRSQEEYERYTKPVKPVVNICTCFVHFLYPTKRS